MAIPSKTLNAIICFQVLTKAVHIVIRPKLNVMKANHLLGPKVRTAIVLGSWKAILAIVKMKMLTLYLFPVRSKSVSIDVTEADEMTPESRRFKEQRTPAIVQRRMSTLRRRRRSNASCSSVASPFIVSASS
jgi:hypothetical protein